MLCNTKKQLVIGIEENGDEMEWLKKIWNKMLPKQELNPGLVKKVQRARTHAGDFDGKLSLLDLNFEDEE